MNLLAHIVRLANSPEAPRCQGWNPEDPVGCWTHDGPRPEGIDYCDGFRLFASLQEAEEYANTLGLHTLGIDFEVNRWAVTPVKGTYGS